MAWNDELVPTLRVVVNDLGATPTYTDDRLKQVLVTAAKFVVTDVHLSYDYTVSVSGSSIVPDPVANNDVYFQNLTVLKGACLVDQGAMRTNSTIAGIKASLGPASLSIDGGAMAKFFEILSANGPCKAYETMKFDYSFGKSVQMRAILSPFVHNQFHPTDVQYNYYSHRE